MQEFQSLTKFLFWSFAKKKQIWLQEARDRNSIILELRRKIDAAKALR